MSVVKALSELADKVDGSSVFDQQQQLQQGLLTVAAATSKKKLGFEDACAACVGSDGVEVITRVLSRASSCSTYLLENAMCSLLVPATECLANVTFGTDEDRYVTRARKDLAKSQAMLWRVLHRMLACATSEANQTAANMCNILTNCSCFSHDAGDKTVRDTVFAIVSVTGSPHMKTHFQALCRFWAHFFEWHDTHDTQGTQDMQDSCWVDFPKLAARVALNILDQLECVPAADYTLHALGGALMHCTDTYSQCLLGIRGSSICSCVVTPIQAPCLRLGDRQMDTTTLHIQGAWKVLAAWPFAWNTDMEQRCKDTLDFLTSSTFFSNLVMPPRQAKQWLWMSKSRTSHFEATRTSDQVVEDFVRLATCVVTCLGRVLPCSSAWPSFCERVLQLTHMCCTFTQDKQASLASLTTARFVQACAKTLNTMLDLKIQSPACMELLTVEGVNKVASAFAAVASNMMQPSSKHVLKQVSTLLYEVCVLCHKSGNKQQAPSILTFLCGVINSNDVPAYVADAAVDALEASTSHGVDATYFDGQDMHVCQRVLQRLKSLCRPKPQQKAQFVNIISNVISNALASSALKAAWTQTPCENARPSNIVLWLCEAIKDLVSSSSSSLGGSGIADNEILASLVEAAVRQEYVKYMQTQDIHKAYDLCVVVVQALHLFAATTTKQLLQHAVCTSALGLYNKSFGDVDKEGTHVSCFGVVLVDSLTSSCLPDDKKQQACTVLVQSLDLMTCKRKVLLQGSYRSTYQSLFEKANSGLVSQSRLNLSHVSLVICFFEVVEAFVKNDPDHSFVQEIRFVSTCLESMQSFLGSHQANLRGRVAWILSLAAVSIQKPTDAS